MSELTWDDFVRSVDALEQQGVMLPDVPIVRRAKLGVSPAAARAIRRIVRGGFIHLDHEGREVVPPNDQESPS